MGACGPHKHNRCDGSRLGLVGRRWGPIVPFTVYLFTLTTTTVVIYHRARLEVNKVYISQLKLSLIDNHVCKQKEGKSRLNLPIYM